MLLHLDGVLLTQISCTAECQKVVVTSLSTDDLLYIILYNRILVRKNVGQTKGNCSKSNMCNYGVITQWKLSFPLVQERLTPS